MQFSTIYIYILGDFISDSCIEPGTRNATITFVRFRNNIISRERPKFSRKWLLDWRINRAMEFLEINYFAVGEAAWNETRLYTCDRVPAHVFRERRVILISERNNRDRDSRGGGTRGMKIRMDPSMLIPEKLDACLAWFHDTCTEHLTVSPFPLKIIASTSFVSVVHERNVIKQITRTGLKFNGCSRHRAYQRPALSRFSRVPFLPSHFHQVSRHRDKLYDCSFLRVPPRSTDLWSNHRSLSSSFYLSFFFSLPFFRDSRWSYSEPNVLRSFFWVEFVQLGDEFCLMIMRFNCTRYCILY